MVLISMSIGATRRTQSRSVLVELVKSSRLDRHSIWDNFLMDRLLALELWLLQTLLYLRMSALVLLNSIDC